MSDINKTYVFETVLISGGTTGTTAEFITGATFNTATGDLNLETVSGNTISVSLEGRYALTGHTHDISEITGFTDNSTQWDEAFDDSITGITVTGTATKTITLFQRDGSTLSTNFTDISGGGSSGDDYTITAELSGDTLNFTRLSGGTYSVILSGLTGSTVAGPVIFETETSGSTSYVGYGELNACKIKQVITISGGTYTGFWSEGVEDLDKIWVNRLTYSYF